MGRISLLVSILFVGAVFSCLAWGAEVERIGPRDYFPTLLREIDRSTSSLVAVQFLFNLNLADKNSPTTKIARALIAAKERGVDIEVILDQNIDFADPLAKEEWVSDRKNLSAYEYLKASGISVYFDSPATLTHAKIVVFDGQTVLLGSSNWSNVSLNKNMETNVLIRNRQIAEEFLNWISALEKNSVEDASGSISVPESFLIGGTLGNLVTAQDERGADLALILFKVSQEKGSLEFDIDFEAVAGKLNLKKWGRIGWRRAITKVLDRLEKKVGLIRFEKRFGKDAQVTLNETLTGSGDARIPVTYWQWGWSRRLSFAGKVFYFISLKETARSNTKAQWSLSGKNLSLKYGVSEWFISRGVRELKEANLLIVQYDDLDFDEAHPRLPNVYYLKPLYDPAVVVRGLADLERKHGTALLNRALKCAELVFAKNDLEIVEKFIQYELRFGRGEVGRAYRIMKLKNPDNPKRTAAYFFAAIANKE